MSVCVCVRESVRVCAYACMYSPILKDLKPYIAGHFCTHSPVLCISQYIRVYISKYIRKYMLWVCECMCALCACVRVYVYVYLCV